MLLGVNLLSREGYSQTGEKKDTTLRRVNSKLLERKQRNLPVKIMLGKNRQENSWFPRLIVVPLSFPCNSLHILWPEISNFHSSVILVIPYIPGRQTGQVIRWIVNSCEEISCHSSLPIIKTDLWILMSYLFYH